MFKSMVGRINRQQGGIASAATPDSLVELRHVVKTYDTPAGPFTALKNIDLTIKRGEFVAVIGKSGSGKSTLINMVTGIDRPTLGEVFVAQTPIHTLTEREIARWRGINVGVVFQFFQLLPTLTILENIMLPMEFCQLHTPKERHERAMHLLDLVGITPQAHKFPATLSGGQQQRAAIVRALANDPDILVADEPTGNLDTKTADSIFQIFTDFVAQGKTIMMVTHDRELANRVDRVIVIGDGQIVDEYVSEPPPQLDEKQLERLSFNLEPLTFPPGKTVFQQGEQAEKFYIIVKGYVDVLLEHVTGAVVKTEQLGPGQYFGGANLAQNGRYNATIRVSDESDAILVALDRIIFKNLVEDYHFTSESIASLMRQHTTTNHLRKILDQQLKTTEFQYEVTHIQPGELIIRQGDLADKFYLINKGKIDIMSPHDKTEVIAQLVAGQYFGEMGILYQGRRANNVRATPDLTEDVELIAIDQEIFHKLLIDESMVQDEIATTMQQRLKENISIDEI